MIAHGKPLPKKVVKLNVALHDIGSWSLLETMPDNVLVDDPDFWEIVEQLNNLIRKYA